MNKYNKHYIASHDKAVQELCLSCNGFNPTMTKIVCLTLFSMLPPLANAETCTPTPDCKSLGYTETGCPDDKGVRCPWNINLWHCDSGCAIECEELGYKYDCKSDNATGGSGKTCGGKYSKCSCSAEYTWNAASEICKYSGTGLKDGLYYCKGVVKGIQVGNANLVVGLKNAANNSWNTAVSECANQVFCGEMKGHLPTKEELLAVYNNINTIQNLLPANGGSKLASDFYWTSSSAGHDSRGDIYYAIAPHSGSQDTRNTPSTLKVRCMLAF